ncbi:MAG TPA: endonuclease [Saprospiraceae bacterium]|nr:endonuclease [Saprospiraceae bacterium]
MLKKNLFFPIIRIFILSFFCIILCIKSDAQLFTGLEGEQLVEAIQSEYTPQQLLNDTQVKDTLYARIFIENDSVECIYSGLSRFLPEGVDPSQYLFGSGLETESLNLEHAWPQAKGAGDGTDGNMNMHHLYPSRVEINSDRGNHPYLESPDQSTQKWYLLYQEMSGAPVNNRDAYSELGQSLFEPRESVKGDIARAMFYFWTIYREDAVEADPDFFELQRENLCSWHKLDPVDNFESLRNERIAFYQDGKFNPFILDCSLADRAYCPNQNACETSVNESESSDVEILIDPSTKSFQVTGLDFHEFTFGFYSVMGQLVTTGTLQTDSWNEIGAVYSGLYFVILISGDKKLIKKVFIP